MDSLSSALATTSLAETESASPTPPINMPAPTSQTNCRLFTTLPGELRNRIYRLVLVKDRGDLDIDGAEEDSRIAYTSTGHDRPALLDTCKRIRSEALEIFYYENHFTTDIQDFDAVAASRFHRVIEAIGLDGHQMHCSSVLLAGNCSWDNLIEGLRLYHEVGFFPSIDVEPEEMIQIKNATPVGDPTALQFLIVSGMFSIVRKLRGLHWNSVYDIVAEQRMTLARIDRAWEEE